MPKKGLRFKAGDRFEPWILNAILQEQDRWRGLTGSGMVHVDGADGDESPTIVDYRTKPANTLLRVWLPTGIAAGTFGAPASAANAVLAVRSGNGWTTSGGTTITVWNADTTAVTGAKAGWATLRDDGTYELVLADC
jgi:hypothetical protein